MATVGSAAEPARLAAKSSAPTIDRDRRKFLISSLLYAQVVGWPLSSQKFIPTTRCEPAFQSLKRLTQKNRLAPYPIVQLHRQTELIAFLPSRISSKLPAPSTVRRTMPVIRAESHY